MVLKSTCCISKGPQLPISLGPDDLMPSLTFMGTFTGAYPHRHTVANRLTDTHTHSLKYKMIDLHIKQKAS